MKKIVSLILVTLLAIGLFSGCVVEEAAPGGNTYNIKTVKDGYLTVVTSPDYAPYEFYALDENGKPQLCHTLNNTCVAPPRMLIAFLENNLQADGTVHIPEVLRPYMGGTEKLVPKK